MDSKRQTPAAAIQSEPPQTLAVASVTKAEEEPRAIGTIATQTVTTEATNNDNEVTARPDGAEDATDGHEHEDAASVASSTLTKEWEDSFNQDLRRELDSIQTRGTFASFHPLAHVNPGLFVHHVGTVGLPHLPHLPLPEGEVRRMIEVAVHAPFGKGSETIVDTAVRNTWELEPGQFELRNPRWAADLQNICSVVAADLGVTTPVNAELYKLLIYEKGAMFKSHTDTEKCPGMFGTLVICLPCSHKGGDVVVKHCGETKTFKTSGSGQHFACWFSDVNHEVLPVTEGYRVVLTYNLTVDPAAPQPSAGLQREQTHGLRHTLRRWLKSPELEADHVYYGLDHEYTEASISTKALKGRDAAVVQTLQELSAGLEFDVLLALTEKREIGSTSFEYVAPVSYNRLGRRRYEDYDYEEDGDDSDGVAPEQPYEIEEMTDTDLSVKVLVDLSGRPILRDIELDFGNVLQADDFFDGVKRQEEYEGYQGNWGPSATHWYCVTAALIIRRDRVASYLKNGMASQLDTDENIVLLLNYLTDSILEASPNSKSSFDTLKYIWGTSFLHPSWITPMVQADIMSKVLRSAVAMEEWDFFEKVAEMKSKKDLRGALRPDYYQWLYAQVSEGRVAFSQIKKGLASTISMDQHFFESCKAIEAFAPIDQPLSDEIREWARDTLTKSLKVIADTTTFLRPDGLAVVASAEKYADFEWLSSVAMPLIEELLGRTPAFALEFLSALLSSARRKAFPVTQAVNLYKRLAKNLISMLDLNTVHGPRADDPVHKAARFRYDQRAPLPPPPDHHLALNHVALADLFSGLIKLESSPPQEDLALPLALKIVSHAPNMHALDFPVLWIPLLRELLSVLEATKTPLDTPRYQQIFAAVLEAYRDNYVGAGYARPPSGQPGSGMYLVQFCCCSDCSKLDAFLADPRQTVCRLYIGAKRQRHHVHRVIEEHGLRVTHVTEGRGGPQPATMVVTKVGQTEDARHQARAKEAEQTFQSFDQTKLGVLLGEDYPAIATALWKRPVNLASGPGGATYMPAPFPVPVRVPAPAPAPAPAPGLTAVGSAPGPPLGHFNVPAAEHAFPPPPMNGLQPMNGSAPVPKETHFSPRVFAPMTGNAGGPLQPPPPSGLNGMSMAAAAGPSRPPPPVAGEKRKAEPEIIDLT
ncbi:2OG-Fe(II)oxygenase superfamily protein [Colletotrichum orchidophilum]|uniref:2OG-Fe(II)oxygenase superfamily protein n=1 Tax=Colletotrichum orchidophilum TaxID=1209926 RepID=A0A1G4B536_9PEZI|nr:2OG-Fe(II)oxygenase superfamily protein [Colletotrichum orchidophilum]OHE96456.1 2OG-Fe(II)oxygenase superfamily protein [Colletotrichum orchidophilum]